MKNSKKKVYKILLLGDMAVGKTSIIQMYTKNKIPQNHITTIGIDYATKMQKLNNGTEISFQIWDTAGQERFNSLTNKLYKSANGLILVYDITSIKSFENINKWLETIKRENNKNVKLLLVGNKIDLENQREVNFNQIKEFSENYGIDFIEISAKENIKVENVFIKIGELLCDTGENNDWIQLKYEGSNNEKKKNDGDGCC